MINLLLTTCDYITGIILVLFLIALVIFGFMFLGIVLGWKLFTFTLMIVLSSIVYVAWRDKLWGGKE